MITKLVPQIHNIKLLLELMVFFLAATFYGNYFVTKLKNQTLANLRLVEFFIVNFTVGTIFLYSVFMLLGIFGVLNKNLFAMIYILPVISICISYNRTFITIRNLFAKLSSRKYECMLTCMLLIVFFGPAFLWLLMPATGWDALAYHLPLLKHYFSYGYFKFSFQFPQTAYPVGFESLFFIGEYVKDTRFANYICYMFLFMTPIFVYTALNSIRHRLAIVALATIGAFGQYFYSDTAFGTFIDFGLTFYTTVCLVYLQRYLSSKNILYLFVTVLCALFIANIKYTSLIITSTVLLVLLLSEYKNVVKLELSKIMSTSAFLVIILCLITIFWYLKNYIYTLNPFYPMFNELFLSLDYDPTVKTVIEATKSENAHSIKINLNNIQIYTHFALCIILFVIQIVRRAVDLSFVSSLLFVVIISYFLGPLERYLMPVIYYQLTNGFVMVFDTTNKTTYGIKLLVCSVLAVITFFSFSKFVSSRHTFYDGYPDKTIFRALLNPKHHSTMYKSDDSYKLIEFVNKNLNEKKHKALILYDNRIYYYKIPVYFDSPTKYAGIIDNEIKFDNNQILKKLKSDGYTHVVLNEAWSNATQKRKKNAYDFLEKHSDRVYDHKHSSFASQSVYKIKFQ